MGILDFLKKNKKEEVVNKAPKFALAEKKVVKAEKKSDKKEKKELLKPSKKNTKNAYRIFLKPLVTEKAAATNTYLFAVDAHTNKQEVKKAVKLVYGVKPVKVNIMNFGGKKVRWGKSAGATKAWKKAVVYLKKEDKIDIYGN